MKKELIITLKPNTLSAFEFLMNEGHKAVERGECKDFICQINWKQDCVKLYLVK